MFYPIDFGDKEKKIVEKNYSKIIELDRLMRDGSIDESENAKNVIKRMLGASFVGWITEKDKKTLIVKVQGNSHPLPLEGGEITEETCRRLIFELTKHE